jgi:phosphoribosylanthranilate isomerase
MVKAKVCGITELQEAHLAVAAGANALGFVFAKSKRQIHPEKAREISLSLPPFVSRVGVFVNEDRHVVQEIASFCDLDVLQFHGDEPPEYCRRFSQRLIKAIAVKDMASLEILPEYKNVHAFLLDAYHPSLRGGTGETFNWDLAIAAKAFNRPVILAGGLTVANIREAVLTVQPYGIDVSSGVEYEGKKTKRKLDELFSALRGSIDELSKISGAG